MKLPIFQGVYLHVRTGNRYKVVGFATNATKGAQHGQTLVLYTSLSDGKRTRYAREVSEFMDGRFTLVPE